MRRLILLLMSLLAVEQAACAAPAPVPAEAVIGLAQAVEAEADRLPAYQPRFGRTRPVVAVVAENYYTELSDYVVPYSILSASNAADVHALATQPGTVRMFPASLTITPQATTDDFDKRFPEGADYVIVPAVHRDDDPKLVGWVAAQARKGATVVGVCDGVWVLGRAGLLEGRNATGHWYSFDDLRKTFPKTQWLRGKRYVADGKVVTTTGVTATIPVSFALVEAIQGREKALTLAKTLGIEGWSAAHPSERFRLGVPSMLTIAGNYASFWSHEDVGIPVAPGVDELALVLEADAFATTFKSTVYTVSSGREPIVTRRGLTIVPDRVTNVDAPRRMLAAPRTERPLRSLDEALGRIATAFGERTAAWVRLQMEYPGY
ncbi:DJ-1/PfpI family protein [Cupriavidus consociatus]|uniref:DJ-1/PfpI family protein n=1 Tax=Cupriavidus consociatus TaxID=2821357 RepID=UPI001AE52464|nr:MULTISPECIES: DJ-1/PfpI family protein [unclassified Cupriavidus]MBP0624091.1 DJ-1/PfpI family protein [Cupriavidus sp. LEh25]MDK2660800.1 DJ-1/PfpI family protein [Cupriavidus sp. LEh21]